MRSMTKRVNPGGRCGERGEAEVDSHVKEDSRVGRDDVGGKGQELSEEEELRIAEDMHMSEGNGRRDGDFSIYQKELPRPPRAPPHLQKLLPSEVPIVRWERFLPTKSLKVLLVENDYCTRQVVSALLRNCCYEVTATGNGLEAWKILEDNQDITNHVDLVLTEVVIPALSGIGLLCKIMSHKTLKNIPVIMMSSHGSMGVVFKCLSKGAVDFLVKPIRKNELKNLWQHVWRRCHSSSGSDSESGVQTKRSLKSNSGESNNNMGSNGDVHNASSSLIVKDGSDNGSGTQSSWTKHVVETENRQPSPPSNHLAKPLNGTSAHVTHSKTDTFCNEYMPLVGSMTCEEKQIHDNISKKKDPKIILLESFSGKNVSFLNENLPPNITGSLIEEKSENDSKKKNHPLNEDLMEFDGNKHSTHVADVIGTVSNTNNSHIIAKVTEAKDKFNDGPEELASHELISKKLASTRDGGTATVDEWNILRHSDVSAFSRYITCAASNRIPTECGANYSFPVDSSSEAEKMEVDYNPPLSTSNCTPLNQGSNDSGSNNNYMKCTTNNATTYPEKPATISVVKGTHASAFHSVQPRSAATKDALQQEKINDLKTGVKVFWPKAIHPHVQARQQSQNQSDQDESNVNIVSSNVPQCGSSNVRSVVVPEDYNAADYSINRSGSGSNHGSNANTGFIVDSGIGNGNGTNENRWSAQREAALNKFRQKRKERCFEKKVRYQNRKKLAEQRPRVRGQFVCQAVNDLPKVLIKP